MKMLFTGAHGYIGTLLSSYLLQHQINAIGLDTGYYCQGWLYPTNVPRLMLLIDRYYAELEQQFRPV
jgi:UDP-glucose 4-epimerase